MVDFRITRVIRVEASSSVSASVTTYFAASASWQGPNSGSLSRAWGIMVPTGSASGSVNTESGSILLTELTVGQPYVMNVRNVVCNRDHVYILQ